MTRSTRSFGIAVLHVALWITALTIPGFAQQPASNQEIFADYYASVESIKKQHQQALAEIDERYTTALSEYRVENINRAQSLSDLNMADHKALREKGLKGAQRQSEFDKAQAQDKKRRAEYAEWRDTTAQRLRQEHAAARSAEIERHQAEMNRLLADRKAKLAGIRALDGSIGLTPGATAALEEAAPSDDGTAEADPPASRVSDAALPRTLPPPDNIGNEDLLGNQGQTLPVPAGIEPQEAGTTIAVAFPDTGDLVEVGDAGVSTQAFELSATSAVSKTIRGLNFRVLHADGTIVLQQDVCGVGTARAIECGNNPRFSEFVDLSEAGSGPYRLAVQALDSEGDAVSRVVEFQIPYRAVVTTDVEIATLAEEPENGDCTWTISGSLIDWGGNPVAGQALLVEARRDSKRRVREHKEWTDWNARKWGAVTTDDRGHFSLTSRKLDHCGGEREFRVSTQVGAWNLNLGQSLLTGDMAVIPEPLVLPRAESNTTFDILTYNTALIIGGGGQGTYRARSIGRRVHRYHVVVFNEAFRNRLRGNLINELSKTWREAGHETTVVGDGRPLFDNGGVDIVTRLPVLEEHATEYSSAGGFDRVADKGAVHARVRANNGQLIDIFATHLQAGGDRAAVRVHQLSELRDFIRRHSDRDLPFLVLGDMNLKTPAEQSNAIRILRQVRPGVRDAWQWKGSGECVTKADKERCLDFIYVGNVSVARPLVLDRIAVRMFEDAASKSGFLSDHFGLEAGFTTTPVGTSP